MSRRPRLVSIALWHSSIITRRRFTLVALDQCRENRSYLELHVPFRAIDLRMYRVILDLQVEFHWHEPEFAQLSDLQAQRKCHFVTARRFSVHKHIGICSNGPSVREGVDKSVDQAHLSYPSAVAADRKPLLRKHIGYEVLAHVPDRCCGSDLPFVLPDPRIRCSRKDKRWAGSKQPVTDQSMTRR